MYSYNSVKHNYLQVGESLEVYGISTKLPLSYTGPDVQTDSEKDFDHLKQLIGIYGKILFFTAPVLKNDSYEFKFGVEQPNLFALKSDDVGVLKKRLNNLVMFADTICTEGVNSNTWISKF